MGKKILVQRKGRGTSQFRAAGHKRRGPVKYRKISPEEKNDKIEGEIIELMHEPGRGAPLAVVKFEDGLQKLILPSEAMSIGDKVEYGKKAEIKQGNVLPLSEIPPRTPVFNIERSPGDGGKLVRTSGGSATVGTHREDVVQVDLPSGEIRVLLKECRATVGIVAGSGRTKMPFVKAGTRYHQRKAKGKKSIRVRGVAMNAVSHPFGGGAHQSPGKASTTSRDAPPGRKVGLIAASRTGPKKGRRRRRVIRSDLSSKK
ncbi:MAG: 50S ribosomal protein L2 [Candidatus Kariarchaeaceae archaeon]